MSERQKRVLAALARLLRPLVRFLIREQITFPILADQLRALFVDVAHRDFRLDEDEPSASRVALLTGVHRKEVKRQRALRQRDAPATSRESLGARLIADWHALPRFLDAEGHPRPLNRSSRRPGPSIRDLVETAGKDIRPQAVLDEWLRQGVVEVDGDGRIALRSGAFVPEHDFDEKLGFFARILSAHIAAGTHNLSGEGSPMLDQVVYYGGLRSETVRRLAQRARELGLDALRTWNREARAAQDADAEAPDARGRIHFGAYAFEDEAEADA